MSATEIAGQSSVRHLFAVLVLVLANAVPRLTESVAAAMADCGSSPVLEN